MIKTRISHILLSHKIYIYMIEQHASVDMDNRFIDASPNKDFEASNKLIIHAQKHDAMPIIIFV